MHLYRRFASTLVGLALAASAAPAFAAAAVAAGSNGFTYTVTGDKHLDQAKADALAACQARARDCEIIAWSSAATAIALAKSADGSTISAMRATPEAARDAAMQACRKRYKACRFAALYWEPGGNWYAWATAKYADGTLVTQYFSYEFASEAQARQAALAGCTAQLPEGSGAACTALTRWGRMTQAIASSSNYSAYHLAADQGEAEQRALQLCREGAKPGDACKLVASYQNSGEQPEPKTFARAFAQSQLGKERAAAAKPAVQARIPTQALTCTNRCVNGHCVRSFPDGRTERWQAPRVFDPFKNDWKWDTSSCGG